MAMSSVWRKLPDDLVLYLANFMDPISTCNVRLVCKSWRYSLDNKLRRPKRMLATGACVMRFDNSGKRLLLDLHPPDYVCPKRSCTHRCVSATATGLLLIKNNDAKPNYKIATDVFVTNPLTRSWIQLPPFPQLRMDKYGWTELLFTITSDGEDVVKPSYKVVAIYYHILNLTYFVGIFYDGAREWIINSIKVSPSVLILSHIHFRAMKPVLDGTRVYFVHTRTNFNPYTLSFIDVRDQELTPTKVVDWGDVDVYPSINVFNASLVIYGNKILLVGLEFVRTSIWILEDQQWTVLSAIELELDRGGSRIVGAYRLEEEIIINLSGQFSYFYSMTTNKWSRMKLTYADRMEPHLLIPFQMSNSETILSSTERRALISRSSAVRSLPPPSCLPLSTIWSSLKRPLQRYKKDN